ncbi:MAG: hypothetical protein CVU43_15065 [Chloroflexi bacterium HGW-Chloroflexi-5]|nr:MAG: hypothetical protein CVU43_15065 [Chloroflexi bacterium HGW-Chloroflexi-5]
MICFLFFISGLFKFYQSAIHILEAAAFFNMEYMNIKRNMFLNLRKTQPIFCKLKSEISIVL